MDNQTPFDANNFDQFRYSQFAQFPNFLPPQQPQNQQQQQLQLQQNYNNLNNLNVLQNPLVVKENNLAGLNHFDQAHLSVSNNVMDQVESNGEVVNEEHEEVFEDNKLPRATLQQKISVLDWYHSSEKKSQQLTVHHFKQLKKFSITKSSMNRWIKDEPKLREDFKNISFTYRNVYKTRPNLKNPEINRALEIFYEQNLFEKNTEQMTERLLLKKFEHFAMMFDPSLDSNKAKRSNGWLHHFKKKNSDKKKLITDFFINNDNIFQVKYLNNEKNRLKEILNEYKLCDIYHFDEFKINSDLPGIKNYLTANVKIKELLIGICVNADGSDFPNPLIIGSKPKPKFFSKNYVNYYSHPSSNITMEIFHEFITNWDKKIDSVDPLRKIVVLVDTLYAHIIPTKELKHIKLVYFSPNFISYLSYPIELFDKNFSNLNQVIPTSSNVFNYKTKNIALLNGGAKKLNKLEIQPINLGISRILKCYFKLNLFEYYLSQMMCFENENTTTIGNFSPESLKKTMNELTEDDLVYFLNESWDAFKQENENYEMYSLNADKLDKDSNDLFTRVPRKNIVSSCFKNCDILTHFGMINNNSTPIVFSDYPKEHKLLKILKVFEFKGLVVLNKKKSLQEYSEINSIIEYLPLKTEDIIFPDDEFVLNKHLDDNDIIEMVKTEVEDYKKIEEEIKKDAIIFEKRKTEQKQKRLGNINEEENVNTFLDEQIIVPSNEFNNNEGNNDNSENIHKVITISKFMNGFVKQALTNDLKDKFPKSSFYFRNFLLSFILESNDFLINSNEFGGFENIERDFDKFYSSLNKRYNKHKLRTINNQGITFDGINDDDALQVAINNDKYLLKKRSLTTEESSEKRQRLEVASNAKLNDLLGEFNS